jgi:cyclophilin family peptidyl-prolyl cis-trans isomerase
VLEDESVVPLLDLALADREPGIRLDAARALARHPAPDTAAREAALLGAYAAAATAWERTALLGVLADVLPSAKAPWLGRALSSNEPLEQEAACLALQRLATRGHSPPPAVVARAIDLVEQGAVEVRGACASVIAEPVARETASSIGSADQLVRALAQLASSPDLEAARLATQALSADDGEGADRELTALMGSSTPGIAIEAVRGLRRRASASVLKAAAERELARLSPKARSGRAGILVELLSALEQHPDAPEAADTAQRVLRATTEPGQGAGQSVRLERALLHCAAARLADAVRHWPKQLFTCGHGAVPEALRDVWIAGAFGRADGSDDLRAVQLTRLFDKGPAPVQVAVLAASATLPVKHAVPLLRAGLRHSDLQVLAAAAREASARPELRARSEQRLGPGDLLESAPRAAQHAQAALAWLRAARALSRHPAEGGDEASIKPASGSPGNPPLEPDASAQAIESTRSSDVPAALIARVTQLARHPALAVRAAAAGLLSEWEAPVPTAIDPVESPLAADRLPKSGAPFHVKLRTTAGAIELELDTVRAPVTAVRFIELVRSGALDGLPVEQASLGHAVSFLPQQGTALRHEATAEVAARGSVLLQDHGRDALGPGFALLLARAPSLDRRAVVIGRIVAGLEVADALLPADAILEARVETVQR